MKRTLLTILAIFYLGISSGATVHFHYCMGKLVEWGVSQSKMSDCSLCKPTKKSCAKRCCKDEQKQIKVEKSQKAAQSSFNFVQAPIVLPNNVQQYTHAVVASVELDEHTWSNAPPVTKDIPVFVRNCNFRI